MSTFNRVCIIYLLQYMYSAGLNNKKVYFVEQCAL